MAKTETQESAIQNKIIDQARLEALERAGAETAGKEKMIVPKIPVAGYEYHYSGGLGAKPAGTKTPDAIICKPVDMDGWYVLDVKTGKVSVYKPNVFIGGAKPVVLNEDETKRRGGIEFFFKQMSDMKMSSLELDKIKDDLLKKFPASKEELEMAKKTTIR